MFDSKADSKAHPGEEKIKPFSEREVVDIIRQVSSAIACLHSIGVVHRDIKPENIFLLRHPNKLKVKVGDLGLSLQLEHQSASGQRQKPNRRSRSGPSPSGLQPPAPLADPHASWWQRPLVKRQGRPVEPTSPLANCNAVPPLNDTSDPAHPLNGAASLDSLPALRRRSSVLGSGRDDNEPAGPARVATLPPGVSDPLPTMRRTISDLIVSTAQEGLEDLAGGLEEIISQSGIFRSSDSSSEATPTAGHSFEVHATTGVRGTPGYIAPELWAEENYNAAVDMWSLGMVAVDCVTSGADAMGLLKRAGAELTSEDFMIADPAPVIARCPALLDTLWKSSHLLTKTELTPIMQDLLQIAPDKRPTAEQMHERCQTLFHSLSW